MCVARVGLNWATMGMIKKDQGSILLPQVHQSSWSSCLWYIILSLCGIEVMFMMFVLVWFSLLRIYFQAHQIIESSTYLSIYLIIK